MAHRRSELVAKTNAKALFCLTDKDVSGHAFKAIAVCVCVTWCQRVWGREAEGGRGLWVSPPLKHSTASAAAQLASSEGRVGR